MICWTLKNREYLQYGYLDDFLKVKQYFLTIFSIRVNDLTMNNLTELNDYFLIDYYKQNNFSIKNLILLKLSIYFNNFNIGLNFCVKFLTL